MIADRARRDRIHGDCGLDVDIAFDKSQAFVVEHENVCWACATRDMVLRQEQAKHENDRDAPGVPSWGEGRLVSVRPATPTEVQAAQSGKRASLTRR